MTGNQMKRIKQRRNRRDLKSSSKGPVAFGVSAPLADRYGIQDIQVPAVLFGEVKRLGEPDERSADEDRK